MRLNLKEFTKAVMELKEPVEIDDARIKELYRIAMGNAVSIENISEEDLISMIEETDIILHQASMGFLPNLEELFKRECQYAVRRAI